MIAYRAEVAESKRQVRAAARAEEETAQKTEREANRRAFLNDHPGLEDDLKVDHPVVKDIADRFSNWCNLSDKQVALVRKLAAESRRPARVSQHVGRIGERITLTVTVDKIIPCEGMMGRLSYLHVMTDSDGNALKWFGSRHLCGVGETMTVKATVKDHDSYNGIAQTSLLRVNDVNEKRTRTATQQETAQDSDPVF